MFLWNTAKKKIEARYGGEFCVFAPNERRREFDQTKINHLLLELEPYGLVSLNEDPTEQEMQAQLEAGLKNRWKLLDWVVRNYKSKNKEREGMKLSAEAPTKHEEECAIEAGEILERLKAMDEGRTNRVENYLNNTQTEQALKAMDEAEPDVKTDGLKTEIKGKRLKT